MIENFLIRCPICSPIRDKLDALYLALNDQLPGTTNQCRVQFSDLDCGRCDGRGKILTPEGTVLAKEILALILPRVIRLEHYALKANPDVCKTFGIEKELDF